MSYGDSNVYQTTYNVADHVTSIDVMEMNGVSAKVGTPTVTIKELDAVGNVVYAVGATVPSNGDAGYAVGSIFKLTTGNGVSSTVFINEGSATSADFNAIETNDGGSTGNTTLNIAHAIYSFATDGGAVSTITPAVNATIPAHAIIVGGTINSTTAVTSSGSATVAVGTSAGSSTTSILGATGKASFTTDALINSAATLAAPVKLSAAGSITITVATAALTAGIIEIFVYYTVASNS